MDWANVRSLTVLVVTVTVTLGIQWLVNRNSETAKECRLGTAMTLVYWSAALMFLTLAYFVIFSNPNNDEVWLKPASILIASTFIFFAIDAPFRRITWDTENVTVKRLFRKDIKAPWSQVTGISQNSFLQYLRLEFSDGSRVGFSEIMTGSRALISEVEQRLNDR